LNTRDEVFAIDLVIGMLELAAAALREMAAGRLLVMRPICERAVIENRVAGNSKRNVTAH
jgi:hypothetical protein